MMMRTSVVLLLLSTMVPTMGMRTGHVAASIRALNGCDHVCAQVFGTLGTETACAMDECVGCPNCVSPDSTAKFQPTLSANVLDDGCPDQCAEYFGAFGIETACAMDECVACAKCVGPDSNEKSQSQPAPSAGIVGDGSYVPPAGTGCSSLYRERQTGLKCGLHAANAVLANLHKDKTSSQEMDEVSEMTGEVSHGDDYDIATIMALLEIYRGLEISTSGGLGAGVKPVSQLLADVGQIDENELARLHGEERAAYERQRRDVHVESLHWLICNVHGHWKAYFKAPETWCNLDSVPARQGIPAAELDDDEMKALQCRAIIVPTK